MNGCGGVLYQQDNYNIYKNTLLTVFFKTHALLHISSGPIRVFAVLTLCQTTLGNVWMKSGPRRAGSMLPEHEALKGAGVSAVKSMK